MMRSILMLGMASLLGLTGWAQNATTASSTEAHTPKQFYRLNFVVQEVENDHVINSRSYSMTMSEKEGITSSIRAGEHVPYASGTISGTAGSVTTQYQQVYIGVDIDCRKLEATSNGVALYVRADVSSVVEGQGAPHPPNSQPIVRSNQWESTVDLPLKQPTIIFSSDDPASKRKMQLQLTVTPIRQ